MKLMFRDTLILFLVVSIKINYVDANPWFIQVNPVNSHYVDVQVNPIMNIDCNGDDDDDNEVPISDDGNQIVQTIAAQTIAAQTIADQTIAAQTEDILTTISITEVPVVCPADFEKHEDNCYYFSSDHGETKVNWETARTKCQGLGQNGEVVDLVEMDAPGNSVSDVWLIEKITAKGPFQWLGASDPNENNGWTWAHSGRTLSLQYPHWDDNQPHSGSQFCLIILDNGKLHDVSCSQTSNYICQLFN